jgi:hypothetical protein
MLVFYIRIYEGVTGKGMIAETREGKEKGLGKGTGIKAEQPRFALLLKQCRPGSFLNRY